MYLLNTHDLTLHEFFESNRPRYLILSHTWSNDETSFAAWQAGSFSYADIDKLPSYSLGVLKVLEFALRARDDGCSWVWVDTCCINKDSSAELSEAINSMYKWYEDSDGCTVYLSDVDGLLPAADQQLRDSRWFTRGWTLQELLAHREVKFFNRKWESLGMKHELAHELSGITGIDANVLVHDQPRALIRSHTIAERMSWAARRVTTREEDTAYCLLGIFQINMSLLYGEGKNAFLRLQKKLIKNHHDETILAWSTRPMAMDSQSTTCGLLATHPSAFADCRRIKRLKGEYEMPPAITSRGIAVQVYNQYLNELRNFTYITLPLSCYHDVDEDGDMLLVGIPLVYRFGTFYRCLTRGPQLLPTGIGDIFPKGNTSWTTIHIADSMHDPVVLPRSMIHPTDQYLIRFGFQEIAPASLISSLGLQQLKQVSLLGQEDLFGALVYHVEAIDPEHLKLRHDIAVRQGYGKDTPLFDFDDALRKLTRRM